MAKRSSLAPASASASASASTSAPDPVPDSTAATTTSPHPRSSSTSSNTTARANTARTPAAKPTAAAAAVSARRRLPSGTTASTSPSTPAATFSTSRATRSSSRRPAAEISDPPPPPQPALQSQARSDRSSRKRKAPASEPRPEESNGNSSLPPSRSSKKARTSSSAIFASTLDSSGVNLPAAPPQGPPLARRQSSRPTDMSSQGPSRRGSNDPEPPQSAAEASSSTQTSKRKSTKASKNSHGEAPQASHTASRRTKKGSKADDGLLFGLDPENAGRASSSSKKKKIRDLLEGNDPDLRSPTNESDGDTDSASAALRDFYSGRGDYESFAQSFRTLGGLISGTGSAHRIREILANLQRKDDPSVQLLALGDLAQFLLVSNEENLTGNVPMDQVVKELVSLMQPNEFGDENSEMMLLACRCIANLIEASPAAARIVVHNNAVPILCSKLLEISYIDLAEQALSTLEKISVDYGASIIEAGGLTACLTYLDFFPTSTQRSAVTTAANCCRHIPLDCFSTVRDVMPTLMNVLGSNDQRVVEQGSVCVSRIVENFRDRPDKLEELVHPDLLRAILRLLLPGTTNLIGPHIHTQFLRVLAITARASPTLSTELFGMDVVDTLYQILTGVSPPAAGADVANKIDSALIMQALIHRPREQIFETLNVICELLPAVPGMDASLKEKLSSVRGLLDEESLSIAGPTSSTTREARLEQLSRCQDKVGRFATILMPTLVHAYSSTVNLSVRRKVLAAQLKMLSNLDTQVLEQALRPVAFASYLASILSQSENPLLTAAALQAAEELSRRLPAIYDYQFCREGVVAAISKLAERPVSKAPESKQETNRSWTGAEAAQYPTHLDATRDESHSHADDAAEGEQGIVQEPSDEDDDDDDHDDDDNEEGDGDEPDEDDDEDDDDDDDEEEEHVIVHEDLSRSSSASSSEDLSRSSSASSSEVAAHRSPDLARILQDFVTFRAQKFLLDHQNTKNEDVRQKAQETLSQAREAGRHLRDAYTELPPPFEEQPFDSLAGFFDADALKSITSAELLNSEIIDNLLAVLEGSNEDTEIARAAMMKSFMRATPFGGNHSEHTPSPFNILTSKLQDLLSRSEHFEVVTVHTSALDGVRSGATSMLAKQLRLRLLADDDTDVPRPYRNMMVSIHAIATFKALDDHLRPRMSLSERSRLGRSHDGLPSSLAAFAAAAGLSPHARLLDRTRSSTSEAAPPPPIPPPAPPSAPAEKRALRSASGGSSQENLSSSAQNSAPQTPQAVPREASPHRHVRRSKSNVTPAATAATTDSPADVLECADERQLSDEDELDGGSALDAFVEDLEDEMDRSPLPDPSAVNLEVASSGKVTAREEDGTRIPTPASHTPALSQTLPVSTRLHTRDSLSSGSPATRAMSYAAAIQSVPQDWHLEFRINDRPVTNDTTIYRAVQQNRLHGDEAAHRNVWSIPHTVHFKKVPGPPPSEPSSLGHSRTKSKDDAEHPAAELPLSLHQQPETSKILRLLNILHEMYAQYSAAMNSSSRVMSEGLAQFVNTKLTAKLNRQLEEPLIVASRCLPDWAIDLPRFYPFLFPFETRHLFLQSTSFGYSRSLARWQSNQASNESRRDRHRDDRPMLGRLQRQKVRISRTRILESTLKVMELYGSSSSVLEVEYFEEVGTGLGPTLEFYSSVSKEFSKKKSRMWRIDDSNPKDEYAFGRSGLFPAPMSSEQASSEHGTKVLHLFRMLGKFVARSMLDSRIIDISFSPVFFRRADSGKPIDLSLRAVAAVDRDLAASLRLLKRFVEAKVDIDNASSGESQTQRQRRARDIMIDGASIEDLGLDFTLPGYPGIELIENGSNVPVTIDNVGDYYRHVIDLTVGSGVQAQIDEFRRGFSQVFPYTALRAFTPAELVMLFGRVTEDWSIETLMDSIKADHGFNMDSKSVRNLLQTMSELEPEQRRDFLQFITGSPKLPIGGFKSLTPMFTVVCKPSEPPYTSDDYLPSVMTCVNYLKLPDYTDLDIMRARLFTAIREGQGAFHLS